MIWKQWLFIAGGGALGAVMRYAMNHGVHHLLGRGFPYGTLAVNITGSLFIGLLYILFIERLAIEPHWRAFVITGFLGALTTFSTFSLETLQLVENGEAVKAVANVALSVVVCLFACWLGIILGRQL